ncbi:uncharacterized protein LOC121416957 isoform X2 [Lytechinus variegatus]|uniref:uncharacterized protein LOC121416876 isoform X2 n=1 Tax=Lytechinus variegatus TaxID=7654 RepID=UPI001BB2C2D3|nr:uncharacterized protein LOC121416876 isoform X2 [Lytechinus variegatus]XP_041466427.1 uncharacterized protein LOC121416957 isoform X2 [Lytechinus variegatus]
MERTSSRSHGVSIPQSFPVVLLLFLTACFQVGTIKAIGIYLKDISWSLGTSSTEIGVALGLFSAFGFFPGVGHCMVGICSTVALSHVASEQNFDILYGMGMSGFGLGMVLLPFLAEVFGDSYGWRGGLLLLGVLMANLVPCAMTIETDPANNHRTNNQPSGPSEDRLSSRCSDSSASEDWDEGAPLCQEGTICSNHRPKRKTSDYYDCVDEDDVDDENGSDCPSGSSMDPIPCQSHEQNSESRSFIERMNHRIRQSDFYRDPVMVVMLVDSLLFGLLSCGWHGFLVPLAVQRGYSIHATILMTLFAAFGNSLGRIIAGTLSGRLTKPIILFLGAALLNTLTILCDVFLRFYYVMLVTAFLSALTIAGMSVLGPLAMKKRASPENFDVVYSVDEQFFGLGTFLGGYLSGVVAQHFASYDASFKLLAGVEIAVFLLMFPALLIKKPVDL